MLRQLFSLGDVAAAITDGSIKRVAVLAGAGISVNSGINDFRSAGGLYNTLDVQRLTTTEAQRAYIAEEPSRVVSKEVFEVSQLPYLEVKRKLVLDLHDKVLRPTATHCMIKVLEDHGLLAKMYTQNVDGLEGDTGISEDVVHNVHGKMTAVRCHYCHSPGSFEEYAEHVRSHVKDAFGADPTAPSVSLAYPCPNCRKDGMRSDVVLYGEALDDSYAASLQDVDYDLLLILGTSLTVAPLSELPGEVPRSSYRVVMNNTLVGEDVGLQFGRGRDIFVQGDCDALMSCLAHMLGWSEELKGYTRLMSALSLPHLSTTAMPAQVEAPKQGKRVELLVTTLKDLERTILHSREASIEVPQAQLDVTSHVTAGQRLTIRDFVAAHHKQVKDNMQMIMGPGTQQAVNQFLDGLAALGTEAGMPWYLVIDDPAGDAQISSLANDSEATHRITMYTLTAKERALMGMI